MYQPRSFAGLVEASPVPASVQGLLHVSETCRARQTKCPLPSFAEVALGGVDGEPVSQEGQDKWPGGQLPSAARAAGVSPPGWLASPHPQGVRAAGAQAARPVHVGDGGQLACPGLTMQRHCRVCGITVHPAASSGSPDSVSGSLQTQGDSADQALKSAW